MVAAIVLLSALPEGTAATLFRRYYVRTVGEQEILCEGRVVENGDSVIRFFREKGELGDGGYARFTEIFRRINPHLSNIDKIRTGQYLHIPLRKIAPGTYPGQSSGVVHLPFVGRMETPELLKQFSTPHTVKEGEFVSGLIQQRFGGYGPELYADGVRIFRAINPRIRNLNRVYPGQKILLPDPAIRNQPWYASLFDGRGNLLPEGKEKPPEAPAPIEEAARFLSAKLLDRGVYYFPDQEGGVFALDLSEFPVLEEVGGERILLLSASEGIDEKKLSAVSAAWGSLLAVPLPPNLTLQEILERIQRRRLAGREDLPLLAGESPGAFVKELMAGLSISYSPGTPVSFPYFGVQVKTLGNLVSEKGGGALLADFGELYGGAEAAIEKTGVRVVSLGREESYIRVLLEMMRAMGYDMVVDPVFGAAVGEGGQGASRALSGFYFSRPDADRKVFIAKGVPDAEAVRFLKGQGVAVLLGEFPTEKAAPEGVPGAPSDTAD